MANRVSFVIIAKDSFTRVGKKVAATTKKMRTGFSGLNSKLKITTGRFDNLILSAGAFFGARKFLTEGIKFQDAVADLAAITGTAGKELDFLSDKSLALAKSAKIAQSDVVAAFTQIASAKSELLKDPEGLVKVTEQALLLANAAGVSIPQAVKASVGSLNQFGKGADQSARFVNVIAAGAKVGASLVGQTADALKNVGAIASQFNITFEETNALIQVMAKNEVFASEAGTGLRGVLATLESLGGRFAPSVVGMTDALENLEKSNLSNKKIIKEFGRENLRTVLILRNNIPLYKQWKKEITGTTIAIDQSRVRLATFGAKLRGIGIIVNESLIKTFLKLEEKQVFTNLANDFAKWVGSINESDIKDIASTIKIMADSVVLLTKGLKIAFLLLKGVGTGIGEFAGQIATGNFDVKLSTSFDEAFSVDKIKRIFKSEVIPIVANVTTSGAEIAKSVSTKIAVDVSDIKPLQVEATILPFDPFKPLQLETVVAPIGPLKVETVTPLIRPLAPVIPIRQPVIPQEFIDTGPSPLESVQDQVQVNSQADVNINIKAPRDVVSSVKATAKTPSLKVGINMETAG